MLLNDCTIYSNLSFFNMKIITQNKFFFIVSLLVLMLTSCIKPYEPVIKSADARKFVVSGQVTRGEQIQHVNISLTSSLSEPKYLPVKGCNVKITSDKGNTFDAADMNNGDYEFIVPESELSPGSSFKVDILTPDGVSIVSDFDQIFECPEVDSVYYIVKEVPSTNPNVLIKGIQFYVDLDAGNSTSHLFRWEAIETYEYHTSWPIEWYYDGTVHHVFPPDYSRSICWVTSMSKNIFLLSTEIMAENKYRGFPLHFVDNYSSQRLVYGYSLLVKQYALSKAAYVYWDQMRINSNEQGGLYEKQPLAVRGNLHNVTNPGQNVLGFFGAAAMTSKRIFIRKVENLPDEFVANCAPLDGMRGGFRELNPSMYPVYLYGNAAGYSLSPLRTECVDCLSVGGINVKPAFWPE